MTKKLTASPKVAKEEKWVEMQGAFCRSTGRNPFGLLSVLSTCGACGGKGTVNVKEPYVRCLACGGTGIQPFTRLRCLGCGGKGVRTVEKPAETCPVCQGTGIDRLLYLYFLRCFGTGVVTTAQKAGAT